MDDDNDNEWVCLRGSDTIDAVKARILEIVGTPVDEQRIIFKGMTMYEGTVAELVEKAGEKETVRIKLTCELTGGGIIYSLIWKPFESTEHDRGQYLYIYIYNVLANMLGENDVYLCAKNVSLLFVS